MALFCIPKKFIDVLKESALRDNIQIEQVYNMTSKQREKYFETYTNKQVAQYLNQKFERAQAAQTGDAILEWSASVFSPQEKKSDVYKRTQEKINKFKESGIVGDKVEEVLLEDIITDKMGISFTAEEMQEITKKSERIETAKRAVGNNIGNPIEEKQNIEYFKAVEEMNNYIESRTPASQLAITSSIIGRGFMLTSIKSPTLNVISNVVVGISELIGKRISSAKLSGANNDLVLKYVKFATNIYKQTGFDVSRMMDVEDYGDAGSRVFGKHVHSQGGGFIRATGRIVEQVTFKYLMGFPDAVAAAVHFADSVNLYSTKIANGDKAKARDIMVDAMKINTKLVSPEAQLVRAQAILDAQYATFTNNSEAEKSMMKIKNVINDITGDWKVGDFLYPFVKTPSNVVSAGFDYSIGGITRAIASVSIGLKNGTLTEDVRREAMRNAVRSGFGLILCYFLASLFDPEDFIGAYDRGKAQLLGLENSVENSVKIGGNWVSVDYFGPLAVPLTSFLYARTYGNKGLAESSFQFAKATIWDRGITQLPVVGDLMDTAKTAASKTNMSLSEMMKETGGWAVDQLSARLVPSFISDTAKMSDIYQRKSDDPVSAFIAKIPFARETLPVKENVFGDKLKTENAVSALFFGARVKEASKDPVVLELDRVTRGAEKNITFTDWRKTSSTKIEELRNKVGEGNFHTYTIQYGQQLYADLKKVMNSASYRNADDEEKVTMINNVDAQAQKKIFQNIHFTPTKKKKK